MRRRPILAVVLLAMLANSGLACACSLISIETPLHAHHTMNKGPETRGIHESVDCLAKCGKHSATATQYKIGALADLKFEKPIATVPHVRIEWHDIPFDRVTRWSRALQHSLPPPSTPVSRRDTMLD